MTKQIHITCINDIVPEQHPNERYCNMFLPNQRRAIVHILEYLIPKQLHETVEYVIHHRGLKSDLPMDSLAISRSWQVEVHPLDPLEQVFQLFRSTHRRKVHHPQDKHVRDQRLLDQDLVFATMHDHQQHYTKSTPETDFVWYARQRLVPVFFSYADCNLEYQDMQLLVDRVRSKQTDKQRLDRGRMLFRTITKAEPQETDFVETQH